MKLGIDKRSGLLLLVAAVLASAAIASARLNGEKGTVTVTPMPEMAVPVTVASVKRERRVIPVRSSGRLASKSEMRLSFKTGGLISHIDVDEGDRVEAGELLATLDLREVNARETQAQSNHNLALREYRRVEKLYERKLVSLKQKQDAQTAVVQAAEDLRIARFNKRYSTIRSPATGRVQRRLVEPNELVQAGEPVLIVASEESGWVVRVGLSDSEVVRMAAGDKAEIAFDAFPRHRFYGSISEIAAASDPVSGTFEVEVQLDPVEEMLRSGFIARLTLMPTTREALDFVPVDALVSVDGDKATFYVLDGEQRRARKVSAPIVHLLENELALEPVIENGALVVVEGAPYLRDGAAVTLRDTEWVTQAMRNRP